jgi:hypothetical protein
LQYDHHRNSGGLQGVLESDQSRIRQNVAGGFRIRTVLSDYDDVNACHWSEEGATETIDAFEQL